MCQYLSCYGSELLLLLLSELSQCYWILTTLRKIILSSLGHFAFYILNYSGEMHSWCNWREWSYTRDRFSSTNVVQMISHWHTFQLKIMQNEIFWYIRFTCSGEKIWRSSIRIHRITAASTQNSNIAWYLTVYWHLFKEIRKSFNSNLKCQGQTHRERVLPAEILDLMPDFRDP